ncbi:LANO_0E15610g1_1 [Lachancea nothofagi CBS 11611]|uniref:LANO_0E15610g1_1 n=1 Tax=Lachancea nothofagi CBS 11611 TaxID=1266666 RepID=A0A1G4K160_9SACH|nr:LANO_0E15610g1_1 [Lachancea nothofagi CBS 11611]
MSTRPASHSGSWYSSNPGKLSTQLQQFLGTNAVVSGARIIVSPHAGYSFCGSTMGKAYGALDLTGVKRVFVLGPSHHVYFKNKGLVTGFELLETPMGPLKVDTEAVETLIQDECFDYMEPETDGDEHSLEMQFPMLYATLKLRKISPQSIKVVPIMISHNSALKDYHLGKTLSKYLKDPENAFILSSDFCHWGRRFNFTGYVGDKNEVQEALAEDTEIESLTARSKLSHHQVPVWKSIEILDRYAMSILAQEEPHDKYELWKHYLEVTGNTICGEKAISVMLCALSKTPGGAQFEWPGYSQSSQVTSVMDSSVSYGAGYCRI